MREIKAKTSSGEIVTIVVRQGEIDASCLGSTRTVADLPEYFFEGQRMNLRGDKLVSLDGEVELTILS